MSRLANNPMKGDVIGICVLVVAFGVIGFLLDKHRDELAGKSKTKLQEMHAVVQREIGTAESDRNRMSSPRWIRPLDDGVYLDMQRHVEQLPQLRNRLADLESAIERSSD
jgi:hypothetical protein